METFKIEHFKAENPERAFPRFKHLTPIKCSELRTNIVKALGLSPQIDSLTLLRSIADAATPVAEVNADQDGFDLSALLSVLDIRVDSEVFINWRRFDDIDQMPLQELSTHFDSIWYPSSDDIEIFDSSASWFVLIRHDGTVRVLRSKS